MAKLKYLEHTDEVLVALTLSGDQDAYEALVARYQKSVMAVARRITRDEYLAEDASQEAFVSAWVKLDCLREPARFGAWVRRIAKNCAVNIVTRLREYVSYDVLENAVHAGNCDIAEEDEDEQGEYIALLHESVGRLPARVREIITLHYFEGLSVADIASRLNLAEGTVKWQLHDGRERIKKDLGVMQNRVDKTLVERVMLEVEKLKRWRLQKDKTKFPAAYEKTLKAVEGLPECEEKDHAMADVLLHGFWWIPGQKNDELLARIKEYALKGHNDGVMESVCAIEDGKLWGDARIQWIRDTQIPYLEKHGFPLSMGREWYWLANEYFREGKTDEGFAALDQVQKILTPKDIYYAASLSASRMEPMHREKQAEGIDERWYMIHAYAEQYRIIDGELRHWNGVGRNIGQLRAIVQGQNFIFQRACGCGYRFFIPGARVGDAVADEDGGTLTFVAAGETVVTPCGTFEGCEMWEAAIDGVVSQTWYADGVGIVKQRMNARGEWQERLLKSYTIVGGQGRFPCAAGNSWEYCGCENPQSMTVDVRCDMIHSDEGGVTLSHFVAVNRLKYDENSWGDMVLQMRNDYIRHNDDGGFHLVDVSSIADRVEALAKTPYEMAYSRAACDVMRRILSTDKEMNPERTSTGHWNVFDVKRLVRKKGKLISTQDHHGTDFIHWGQIQGRSDEATAFNDIYGNLQFGADCLWSDHWKDGYAKTIEFQHRGTTTNTTVACRNVGLVHTLAGTFEDCLEVELDVHGPDCGIIYRNGKKTYTYAPGVGLVRVVDEGRTQTVAYELSGYTGTGEGYMPMLDGMDRRFEAVGLTDGYVSTVDYAIRRRGDESLCVIENRCGIRVLPPYDENDWESMTVYMGERSVRVEKGMPHYSDVSFYMERCEALAQTPYQKAHTRLACDALRRILETDAEFNPDRTHSGHWIGFCAREIEQKVGRVDIAEDEKSAVAQWNMHGTGDWGAPIFFGGIYEIWADAANGLWNEVIKLGVSITLEHKRHGYDVTTELSCREIGSVTTELDTFMNCIEVSLEIKGMPYEICFHNGTKKYYFAPGVGIVRTVQDHKDHTLQGVYDLVAYEGKGEGYMPLCEGMTRRYEAQFMREGYISTVEYAIERDDEGKLCLMENRCGIKKL